MRTRGHGALVVDHLQIDERRGAVIDDGDPEDGVGVFVDVHRVIGCLRIGAERVVVLGVEGDARVIHDVLLEHDVRRRDVRRVIVTRSSPPITGVKLPADTQRVAQFHVDDWARADVGGILVVELIGLADR